MKFELLHGRKQNEDPKGKKKTYLGESKSQKNPKSQRSQSISRSHWEE